MFSREAQPRATLIDFDLTNSAFATAQPDK
jgi:hypothetical protein